MAKKKKKDPEKKAALAAKKEAKAEKAARKRIQKTLKDGTTNEDAQAEEEHLDDLISQYRQKDTLEVATATLTKLTDPSHPLPRANATFTLDHNQHIWLFGGEYFNGVENIVLDQLLRFDPPKNEWKLALAAKKYQPPPRCAHSVVFYKDSLYLFGGELANADEYHHYKDLWKFHIPTLTWTDISTKDGPSARSGHTAIVYKSYMIVFGGFYEAARDTKWYNDVHVFSLSQQRWMEEPANISKINRPEPRSACNSAIDDRNDNPGLVIQGGFIKFKDEAKVYTDMWRLNLAPLLQSQVPTWEKLAAHTNLHGPPRCGSASLSYKNRMLVFGGVHDEYGTLHHKMDSVFFNDLLALDLERQKCFPILVRPTSSSTTQRRRRRRKSKQSDDDERDDNTEESSNDDSDLEEEQIDESGSPTREPKGWDLDRLRSNMFAFIDGDGNIIYEKITEEHEKENDADQDEESEEEEKDEEKSHGGDEKESEEEKDEEKQDTIVHGGKEVEDSEEEKDDTVPVSSRRKKAAFATPASKKISASSVMVVNAETNLPEAVSRDEPLPRINTTMVVRGHLLYVYGGLLEVGDREVTLDDMWRLDLRKRNKWECLYSGSMHRQVWRGAVHDDDDSYVSTNDESDDSDDETGTEKKASGKTSGLREEIAKLNTKYDLGDPNRTPDAGEALADFYTRTCEFWNSQVNASEELSAKELKREGFSLARKRYEELEPVMKRLEELGVDGGDGERRSKKSDNKKSSRHGDGRKDRKSKKKDT